jgi:hypothetical protein
MSLTVGVIQLFGDQQSVPLKGARSTVAFSVLNAGSSVRGFWKVHYAKAVTRVQTRNPTNYLSKFLQWLDL